MERAKEFLEDFGEMILDEIDKVESTKLLDESELENIIRMCQDYNTIYKFAEHHHEFECGFLGAYKHSTNIMQ